MISVSMLLMMTGVQRLLLRASKMTPRKNGGLLFQLVVYPQE